MIRYIAPDGPGAFSGGIRKLYDHVAILGRNGLSASITVGPPETMGLDDLLVIPEVYGDLLHDWWPGSRKVSFNQNAHYTWQNVADPTMHPYMTTPALLAVLCVSGHNELMLRFAFPDLPCPLVRITPAIHRRFRHPGLPWRPQRICYFRRKGADRADILLSMLESRGALEGWEVVVLDGMNDAQVVEAMQSSRIFLAFSELEGLPAPPCEAAACGCWVIGFGWSCAVDDLLAMAEEVVTCQARGYAPLVEHGHPDPEQRESAELVAFYRSLGC